MRRILPTLAATTLLSLAAPAHAEPQAGAPRAAGSIESDEGRVEILGRTLRAGDTIELPEGYLRVEEDGREEREVGSFSVVPARRAVPADTAGSPADAGRADRGAATPAGEETTSRGATPPAPAAANAAASCRAERSAYLAELWRLSGIDVSSPADLVEGLEGPDAGPRAGFFWFALQTDPFRPLAWSSELRSRAEALSRCVRGG